MTVAALIVAAGRGHRLGGPLPKQYQDLVGAPLLRHTLACFTEHPRVELATAVIHADDRALFDQASNGLALLDPAEGGPTRQDSVRLGLESLVSAAPEFVLIHDGARPLVDAGLIDRVLDALSDAPAATPALAVSDTLKRDNSDGAVAETVNRAGLWRAQTPQGFHFDKILNAHRKAEGLELTDDAAVAERAGLDVRLVAGSEDNIKVTGPDDMARAARLMGAGGGETRVGSGYDVHRFGPGDQVTLCGVDLPHDQGLAGHSDADVALHAATDALLGAIGAGDIGDHFPPDDDQWKGAPSHIFLARAAELVREAGGRIVHLDITIIAEAPRVGPHRNAMVARIAEIAGVEPGRVSVKATTTERLGFTGRGEGIAAQALATVSPS